MKRVKRLFRLTPMWVKGEITMGSFKLSMNPVQKSICLVGGGMVFCDRDDEQLCFQEG